MHYDNALFKSKNKIKTTWSVIKRETGYKIHNKEPQAIKVDNTIIREKETIANVFNEHFSTIEQTILKDLNEDNNNHESSFDPLNYLEHSYSSSFENIRWHYTTTAEIKKIIKTLKTKYSYGYDEIPITILKISMPYIISPLTYICNKSLGQGVFPDRLKYAVIKPIFKAGEKYEPSNYRPISLLSSFSKVFERLIYNRLYDHITHNNILDENQFGFRPNSSTEKASFKLIEEILNSMNNKHSTGGIFCDLQKAFDCVSHDILIKKAVLWNYREFWGIS
jgi:hypothetical protein